MESISNATMQTGVSAGSLPAKAAELLKEEPREQVDIFMDNSGKSYDENDYVITRKVPGGQIKLTLDNSGSTFFENDFHVTAETPEGNVDYKIDHGGASKYENTFAFKGHDLGGEFNLSVTNPGSSKYECDYKITGTVYGKRVDMFIDNSGNSENENDFKLSGSVPEGFLSSPLFSNVMLPAISIAPVIPVLYKAGDNKENIVTGAFVGPLLLNLGMSFLGAIERQISEKQARRERLQQVADTSPAITEDENQVNIDGVKIEKK